MTESTASSFSSDGLIERAAGLTTSSLSDAMDRLSIAGQVAGVAPVGPVSALCGPAFTVRYRPVATVGETVGDYIDDVPVGAVVAIDNQGVIDCTVWGDILTETASSRGIAGTVIDGISRDTVASVIANYPIFSRGTWMRTGKDRVTVEAVNVPIMLGGVAVSPGDLLVGDRDGVVAIPAARLAEVVQLAESIEAVEGEIRSAVKTGERLDEVRARLGYHTLQRAADPGVETNGGG